MLALGVGLLALIALAALVVGWALRGKELEAQRQKRFAQARGREVEPKDKIEAMETGVKILSEADAGGQQDGQQTMG